MTGDDNVGAELLRRLRQGLEVVNDVEADPRDLRRHGFRKRRGPRLTVVVAAHGDDRRDRGERLQELGRADVAGVDDQVDRSQRRERFGAQQAVGVGDDADLLVHDRRV